MGSPHSLLPSLALSATFFIAAPMALACGDHGHDEAQACGSAACEGEATAKQAKPAKAKKPSAAVAKRQTSQRVTWWRTQADVDQTLATLRAIEGVSEVRGDLTGKLVEVDFAPKLRDESAARQAIKRALNTLEQQRSAPRKS